jgi:hypothetical protein
VSKTFVEEKRASLTNSGGKNGYAHVEDRNYNLISHPVLKKINSKCITGLNVRHKI